MAEISSTISCQTALLVNRKGIIIHVIVGDRHGIFIPDLENFRRGAFRLKGLRCIRTSLGENKGITSEDLTDLALLRLDAMMVIEVKDHLPRRFHLAHLLPPGSHGEKWQIETFKQVVDLPPRFDIFIRDLEQEIERVCHLKALKGAEERAILVHAGPHGETYANRCLDELQRLAETANIQVVDKIYQRVAKFNPAHLIGKGKLKQILVSGLYLGVSMIVFDQNLSPRQANNIAKLMDLKVIDRTQLILDIFARHAKTRGGKIQVELAQLRYTLPRLVGKGTAMSRLMGGIGGKGPGETKLEVDRRRIKQRITSLEKALKGLEKQRSQMRKKRTRDRMPVFSIIGYTNAGKSTLLNRLTKSNVLVRDELFATLDPSTKALYLDDQKVLLSDTVGFITNMPPDIKTAFKATLEELEDSAAFIHVLDASSPFIREEIAATEEILRELDLSEVPRITVLNKMDLLDERARKRISKISAVRVSAKSGQGIDELRNRIKEFVSLSRDLDRADIKIPRLNFA